ncbi:MAG: helix-turn-helix transcriptional regulator [Polyangiales bacterium]
MTNFDVRSSSSEIQAFFEDPFGLVLTRPAYYCAFTEAGTFGMVANGDVGEDVILDFIEVLEAAPRTLGRRRQYIDLRRVRSYSRGAMDALMSFYEESARSTSRFSEQVKKEAVVRPGGALGAFAEGFFRTNVMPFETRVFLEEEPAFAWLEDPLGWGDVLDGFFAKGGGHLTRLEKLIRSKGHSATLAECARNLGASTRTLQRHLQRGGESFRVVRQRVLVAEAKRLLLETSAPVKVVAIELGFTSPRRFTETFRREAGMSPSEYRSQATARARQGESAELHRASS